MGLIDRIADLLRQRRMRRDTRRALHVLLALGVVADAYVLELARLTGLGVSDLYRVLAGLERDGHVHSRSVEPAAGGKGRRLYWITPAGDEAAERKAAALTGRGR